MRDPGNEVDDLIANMQYVHKVNLYTFCDAAQRQLLLIHVVICRHCRPIILDKNSITVLKILYLVRPTLFLFCITERSSLFKSWWHRKKICRYEREKTGMNTLCHPNTYYPLHLLTPPFLLGSGDRNILLALVTQT